MLSDPVFWLQMGTLLVALVMLVGGGYLVYRRTKGWGPATLQAFGLLLLVPSVLVLAANGAVSKDIIATLLGGIAGYLFGRGGDRHGPDDK